MFAQVILAHGAGASCQSEFMCELNAQLQRQALRVQAFNFPYMQIMQETGKRRPPDRAPKLLAAFAEQIEHAQQTHPNLPIFIAGKSMGGRMASMLAADANYAHLPIEAIFAYGYPFFTPKNRQQARCAHFIDSRCPIHILHGDRDSFGKPEELAEVRLPKLAQLHWIKQGNHDFKPLKSSGLTQQDLIAQLAQCSAKLINAHLAG